MSSLRHKNLTPTQVAVVLCVLCVASLVVYMIARHLRPTHPEGRRLPGTWLRKRWQKWTPPNVRKQYSSSLAGRRSVQFDSMTPGGAGATQPSSNDIVDRHTSVRSVMTLPAYSEGPRPTEKLIGREGERGGIDTVIEFPETAEEEESRRDDEMESLYQIRAARRQAQVAREERARLRRELRENGNIAALRDLNLQARAGHNISAPSPAALISQHESRDRERRISTVNYAALGVARHDGSRVRANSADSDRPLLENAAGSGQTRLRSDTASSGTSLFSQFRNLSTPSLVLAASRSAANNDGGTVSAQRTRGNSDLMPYVSQQSSRQTLRGGDLSDHSPASSQHGEEEGPPQYGEVWEDEQRERQPWTQMRGEAPPYESPTRSGAPRLPAMAPLPSIEITPFTPVFGGEEEGAQPVQNWGRL